MKTTATKQSIKPQTFKKPDLSNYSASRNSGKPNSALEKLLRDGELMEVELSLVDADPEQPRPKDEVEEGINEFADQLEKDKFALAQHPVYHKEDNGRFTIVVGERRTLAFKLKHQAKILAVVKKFTPEERKSIFILQYIENDGNLKKPLSILADARWWRNFIDRYHNGNVSEAAAARGRNENDISNRLQILESPDYLQDFAKASRVKDPATYAALKRLHVRMGEEFVKEIIIDFNTGKIKTPFREYVEQIAKNSKEFQTSNSHVDAEKNSSLNMSPVSRSLTKRDEVEAGKKLEEAVDEVRQAEITTNDVEVVQLESDKFPKKQKLKTPPSETEERILQSIKNLKQMAFTVRLLSKRDKPEIRAELQKSIQDIREILDLLSADIEQGETQ